MNGTWIRQRAHIGEMFGALRGNARVIVLSEAFSAIPLQWYMTYLPIYMLALGVSKMQVGLLSSALISMRFVSTLLGGYAADRFGRKRVLVVGDIVCWGVPMLLYAVARDPWYFLVGQLLNGLVYIVLPSFECLFVEDVPERRRPGVFASLAFLTAAASLLAPVSGFLVARYGIVAAGRAIMWANFVALVGMAIVRQFTLHETRMGVERIGAVAGANPGVLLREYGAIIRGAARNRRIRVFLVVRYLAAFTLTVWTTYAAIYLTDSRGLGLTDASIAALPFVAAMVTMLILLAAAGRMRVERTFDNLVWGQGLWLVAAVCFVFSPPGTLVLVLIWSAVNAASRALFQPASSSYWANIVGDRERAQVFAASAAFMALAMIPAGPIAGLLYTLDPRGPFVFGILLQLVSLFLILTLRTQENGEAGDS